MQFDAEPLFMHAITGYGPEGIAVQGQWHRDSLLLEADGSVLDWPVQSAAALFTESDLAWVLEQAVKQTCELVIVGSGSRQIFLPPKLLQPFWERGLPLECMSTPAACRTYNIVASEGRKVLAALRIET